MNNIFYVLLRRLRTPLVVLILVYAVSILGFVVIPGVDDQGRPWQMGFFHAFYFVSFMGSTIGFGEIPYPFTDTQRMWAIVAIYSTVFAWLYGIGTTLSILGDSAFRSLMKETAFRRGVRGIEEPFYLVCGYGDTGSLLVKALADAGIRSVVVDIDENRINSLQLEDLHVYVPGFTANAADPHVLNMAGLQHRHCIGVVALTYSDEVNLTVSIASTLLRTKLRRIARAETHEGEENIASLGPVEVINPFATFASRLALAIHTPGLYVLFDWLTGVPHEHLHEPLFPPHGTWILCGYGRFGKAVHKQLTAEGIKVQVIETDIAQASAPADAVAGLGADAETLRKAGVLDAVGIVAGTDSDANNLSIIITARALNPQLFTVVRLNQRINSELFKAAKLDLVMQRGSVIAHKIFALITTPLLREFLNLASRQSNDWANQLVSRIGGVTEEEAPQCWTMSVTPGEAPALYLSLGKKQEVQLGELCRDPRFREDRLYCFPLLLAREDEYLLVPADDVAVKPGDRILFCGREDAAREMAWIARRPDVLRYVLTGEEHPSTLLGRLFASRRAEESEAHSG